MEAKTEKTADFDGIAQFFVKRLETIFAGVARIRSHCTILPRLRFICLCFAAGNARGAKTAVKIAQDILKP